MLELFGVESSVCLWLTQLLFGESTNFYLISVDNFIQNYKYGKFFV